MDDTPLLKLKWTGRCWELDETGEPPSEGFARLVKREDPDVILSEWGDSTILPLLSQQAERLKFSLNLNRDSGIPVQRSKPRSYTSYGRILFKASAITLFGRIHVDKQNSFISEKCDFAGLWELARVTKLPIQYAARTTTGTGISYMQMELAHRDGVLIPERAAGRMVKATGENLASSTILAALSSIRSTTMQRILKTGSQRSCLVLGTTRRLVM